MARKVFFSFHYADVLSANVVRNSDQFRRRYDGSARFHDKSLWEEAKKQGPLAIKRMINGALQGSSVTCVLIGRQTWVRKWVRYEILKSLARGNGILGVHIDGVGLDPDRNAKPSGTSAQTGLLAHMLAGSRPAPQTVFGDLLAPRAGGPRRPPLTPFGAALAGIPPKHAPLLPVPSPLGFLGYTIDQRNRKVGFHEWDGTEWLEHPDVARILLRDVPWMSSLKDTGTLESVFRVYNWKDGDGYSRFPSWIEAAANRVGR